MDGKAIILTAGVLDSPHAKTAHGLIRSTDRYHILALIDQKFAGKDAGESLDGIHRNIPIYANIADFLANSTEKADYCIIGVATHGGIIPTSMIAELEEALSADMSLISGLHHFMTEIPQLSTMATERNLSLIDVRKPKRREDLAFWSGDIYQVKCPIVAVLGTDCALGKRTTTLFLQQALSAQGLNAQMIYTGQTGWLQGLKYGFIFDSTLNDFVSGELEHAVVSCYRNENPGVILLEGQASLLNPSGPCGSEYLISAQAKHVILQHAPSRKYIDGWEEQGIEIPPISSYIKLIEFYESKVIALSLNTEGLNLEEARVYQRQYEEEFGIPVVLPLEDGVGRLTEVVKKLSKEQVKG